MRSQPSPAGALERKKLMAYAVYPPALAYPGPFPRGKHSHRCKACGEGSRCYKAQCRQPQKLDLCEYCTWKRDHPGRTVL
jgi:hypothetical protein